MDFAAQHDGVSTAGGAAMASVTIGAEPSAVAGLKIPFNDGDTSIEEALRHTAIPAGAYVDIIVI